MDASGLASGGSEKLAEAFVELVRTIVGEFDVHELLQVLVDRCVDVLEVAASGLLLANGSGLQVMAASSEKAQLLELFQLQNDEGPCLECYRGGAPIAVEDLGNGSARWPQFAPAAVDQGFGSVLALPMRVRGEVVGALNLFGTVGQPALGGSAVRIAEAMIDVAVTAIEHGRLSRARITLIEQLEVALESRVAIEQAKGVLATHLDIGVQEAFALLRQRARDSHRLLKEVAVETVNNGGTDFADLRR